MIVGVNVTSQVFTVILLKLGVKKSKQMVCNGFRFHCNVFRFTSFYLTSSSKEDKNTTCWPIFAPLTVYEGLILKAGNISCRRDGSLSQKLIDFKAVSFCMFDRFEYHVFLSSAQAEKFIHFRLCTRLYTAISKKVVIVNS